MMLILLIALPLLAGILIFLLPKRLSGACALLASAANLFITASVFKKELLFACGWAGFGMNFSLRLYHFSAFIVLAVSFFGLLITLYSLKFIKNNVRKFYAYILISVSFVNGAVLASNLVALLFFWEGLLLTLYGLIAIGKKQACLSGRQAFKTATKAFVIVGVSDLCMMVGIILTGYLAKTLEIGQIRLGLEGLGGLAFVLLVIGAISKAGSMPFHTWIPDAAIDAPLPFMALFPAALEKLLGIYFLSRITLDMFALNPGSPLSTAIMAVGAATILLAVMMALIQKDYKRLLSYHAISQVGYMVLGIGTCLPAGIIGGLFHMLNHTLYKCGLFFTGGAVEKEAGTTDLERLGGLRFKMPVTFFCYLITAASISGVPPFNGFFSKELIYDASLERGKIFYLAAIIGSFFTAASFLKLGHAAFLGKTPKEHKGVKEAPLSMLIPMVILAFTCIVFGVFNYLPINNFIQPILGKEVAGKSFAGLPSNHVLIFITALVLIAAFLHHFIAARISGSGLKAADHIHYASVLFPIYRWAEKGYFDPYKLGIRFIRKIAGLLWLVDRGINWVYDRFIPALVLRSSRTIHKAHTGYYVVYVVWSLLGALLCLTCLF